MAGVHVAHRIDGDPSLPDDAPTVVLSNSLGSTMAMWEAQVAELSRVARVVRYDTRGHGASPVVPGPYSIDDLADDVIALLDRLRLARVHLVGLSLGGMTGMRLAARNPERVDRLVVLCTSARLEPTQGWLDRAATVRSQGAAVVADAVVERWYTEPFRTAHPERVAAAVATVSATPAEGYAGCCEAIAGMDLRPDLPSITAPTLAIAGADDPATPPPHLQLIADSVQHGRCLVVPQSAHLANDEQPATITPAILEHLGL
ncbi:3-oxoadipate enol-lactonase [Knoellia sp. CPCC 206435]|uniref:3-oxoadipate enol-lactonase n=1 Tax=Knoellia terrae TaxID=3404797 RepID=UPI003B438B7E